MYSAPSHTCIEAGKATTPRIQTRKSSSSASRTSTRDPDWWKADAKEAWKKQRREEKDASVKLDLSVGAVLSSGGGGGGGAGEPGEAAA
jgi:hypothetical protein